MAADALANLWLAEEEIELLDEDEDVPESSVRAVVVLDPEDVPLQTGAAIISSALSPRAELIACFVDGSTPVTAIVGMSPMTEAETLRALRDLLRSRAIVLAPSMSRVRQ